MTWAHSGSGLDVRQRAITNALTSIIPLLTHPVTLKVAGHIWMSFLCLISDGPTHLEALFTCLLSPCYYAFKEGSHKHIGRIIRVHTNCEVQICMRISVPKSTVQLMQAYWKVLKLNFHFLIVTRNFTGSRQTKNTLYKIQLSCTEQIWEKKTQVPPPLRCWEQQMFSPVTRVKCILCSWNPRINSRCFETCNLVYFI